MDIEGYLRIWKSTCRSRAFELEVVKAHRAKKLPPAPIYLSVGGEHVPAAMAEVLNGPKEDKAYAFSLFMQHRCHSWYLAFGGDPSQLADEILGLPTGCAGGMGGSASGHSPGSNIFGHSGLLGDQVPIAAGYCLGSHNRVIVALGDAAAEEDYVLATLGFAVSKQLPMIFVVEDNNLSILTKKDIRRSWNIMRVADAFGVDAHDINDSPLEIVSTVERMKLPLPALLNIRICRHLWHAGSGTDGEPEWDAYNDFREWLHSFHIQEEVAAIETAAMVEMETLWNSK